MYTPEHILVGREKCGRNVVGETCQVGEMCQEPFLVQSAVSFIPQGRLRPLPAKQ